LTTRRGLRAQRLCPRPFESLSFRLHALPFFHQLSAIFPKKIKVKQFSLILLNLQPPRLIPVLTPVTPQFSRLNFEPPQFRITREWRI
jgi:hypothetical protein